MAPPAHPTLRRGAPHQRGLAYRRRVAGAMTTAMGVLTLAGLTVLPGIQNATPLTVCSVATLALGLCLLLRPEAAPAWSSHLMIGLVTVLITVAAATGGDQGSAVADLTVLYVPTAIYAFYFFSTRLGAAQVAFAGLAYAVLLVAKDVPTGEAVARWATTVAAMVVSGLMVRAMNREVERLVSDLDTLATRDPLTGALNRRGFNERLEVELARAHRTGEPLTLVAADLDGLKAVNDNRGHAAGDEAISLTARVLGCDLRDLDALGRVGGDEFLILLPGCGEASGVAVAQKLAEDLRAAAGEDAWPLSLSMGVVTAPPCALDARAMTTSADAALYGAKALGRDRVVGAERPSISA